MVITLIVKDMFIAFVIVSIVTIICKMAFLKSGLGLKAAFAYMSAILAISWLMVQGDLSVWIAAQYQSNHLGYLSEFVKNKRDLGGSPSKEVTEYLEKLARDGSPCERYHALRALGKPSDVTVDACSVQSTDSAAAASSPSR